MRAGEGEDGRDRRDGPADVVTGRVSSGVGMRLAIRTEPNEHGGSLSGHAAARSSDVVVASEESFDASRDEERHGGSCGGEPTTAADLHRANASCEESGRRTIRRRPRRLIHRPACRKTPPAPRGFERAPDVRAPRPQRSGALGSRYMPSFALAASARSAFESASLPGLG